MEIENHKEEVPFSHYQEQFRSLVPETVPPRLGEVTWDGSRFALTLLGSRYTVSHPAGEVRREEDGVQPPLPVCTFLLRYLLESRDVPWQGSWKTFREMPWGEMYQKPYSGRVLTRAAFTFGTRVADFRKAAEELGGRDVRHGDAGYLFDLIGGYRMQILVWEGDEEFPPNAQVLYSDNFADGFAAEDRVVAGDILISALKAHL